jgi:hypothetical protein
MSMTTTTLTPSVCPIEWISGTPALPGTSFTLRELRLEDAPLLLETLTLEELSAYIRTTPGHGCEPFNIWAHGGGNTSFAVVPVGTDTAVGVVQVLFDENPVMH